MREKNIAYAYSLLGKKPFIWEKYPPILDMAGKPRDSKLQNKNFYAIS